MSVTFGFFNSMNGDRLYTADQMSEYFKGIISDGVCENVGDRLQVVTDGKSMTVYVEEGRAFIDSKWIENSAELPLTIGAADPTYNRYTAVVIRLDRVNRKMSITTKDGTPALDPQKPQMIDESTGITEKCLAYIFVPKGATSINQSYITDTRADTTLCGWVTGLIDQVDTSKLFLQWQAAYENYYNKMTAKFEEWFSDLTDKLNINTYIQKYEKRVKLDGSSSIIPLDMEGYTYDENDILLVAINGLLGTNTYDYLLDTRKNPPEVHSSVYSEGTIIKIMALKSVIGFRDK